MHLERLETVTTQRTASLSLVTAHPNLEVTEKTSTTLSIRRRMIELLRAKAQMPDLEVITGLGLGAEMLGAEASNCSSGPYRVILAFDGMEERWPDATPKRFHELLSAALSIAIASDETPNTSDEFGKAMGEHDNAIIRSANEAIVVRDPKETVRWERYKKLERQFEEDVWIIEPDQ